MKLLVVLSVVLAGCVAQKPQQCTSPASLSGFFTVAAQNEKLFAYVQYMYDAVGQRVRLWKKGSFENKIFSADLLLNYKEATMYQINEVNHTCEKMPLKADFHPFGIPKNASLVGQVVLGSSSGPGEGLLVNSWVGTQREATATPIMLLFYRAVLESIFRYGITAWYGSLTVQLRSLIARLVGTAVKIFGVENYPPLQDLYEQSVIRQAQRILQDPTHILHEEFQRLPSGKFMSTVTELGCFLVSTSYQTPEFGWVTITFFNNVVGISDPSLLNPPDFCPKAEVDAKGEPANFLTMFQNKN